MLLMTFLLITCTSLTGLVSRFTRVVCGIATVVMLYVLMVTLGRRIVLFDEHMVVRDWLFRSRSIRYEWIERIDFYRGGWMTIRISNGDVEQWPASTPAIEAFIGDLTERVTRIRPLQIAGDLEVE
ncbi:MAG: hypothetical protein JWO97_894 [Acidobacteria bacterium]|nr:hypothetical protein [Acidobacteriota bacterium]